MNDLSQFIELISGDDLVSIANEYLEQVDREGDQPVVDSREGEDVSHARLCCVVRLALSEELHNELVLVGELVSFAHCQATRVQVVDGVVLRAQVPVFFEVREFIVISQRTFTFGEECADFIQYLEAVKRELLELLLVLGCAQVVDVVVVKKQLEATVCPDVKVAICLLPELDVIRVAAGPELGSPLRCVADQSVCDRHYLPEVEPIAVYAPRRLLHILDDRLLKKAVDLFWIYVLDLCAQQLLCEEAAEIKAELACLPIRVLRLEVVPDQESRVPIVSARQVPHPVVLKDVNPLAKSRLD